MDTHQHHEKKVSVRALGEKSALKECSLVHDTFFYYHEIASDEGEPFVI